MIVYKTLTKENLSTIQRYPWPVPTTRPTKWLKLDPDETPQLCVRGFHGWLTLEKAKLEGSFVYEMELEGDIQQDHEKATGRRARLTKQLWPVPEIDWFKALDSATTIIEKLEILHKRERALITHSGLGTYNPVPVGMHKFQEWGGYDVILNKDRCGSCGLTKKWHNGWRDRERIQKKFSFFIPWSTVEMLRYMQMGVPLE